MTHVMTTPPSADIPENLTAILEDLDAMRRRPYRSFNLLRDHTDLCADPAVAAVFVECALAAKRKDLAQIALPLTHTLPESEAGYLAARVDMAHGNPQDALTALKTLPEDQLQRTAAHRIRVEANVAIADYDAASKAVFDWSSECVGDPDPFRVMGKALTAKRDPRAEKWLARSVDLSAGGSNTVMDMADFLIKTGRPAEARRRLNTLKYLRGPMKRRKKRLMRALAA